MRIHVLAATLLAALLLPVAALADMAGAYSVAGANFDGSAYAGTVVVTATSDTTYSVVWTTGQDQVSQGIGMSDGHAFAAAYVLNEAAGLAIYEVHQDGSLEGHWTVAGQNGIGAETWTPKR